MHDLPKSGAPRLPLDDDLDALMRTCRRLLSARGEANSAGLAAGAIERFRRLSDAARLQFFKHLAEDFDPDPKAVLAAAEGYAAEPGPDELARLIVAAEPPRQELLRRLNRGAGGTAVIVNMRRQLLRVLPQHSALAAVEADLFHLLSSWFNPGFLEMQQVDWRSPAELLEKIIQHEAVHAIDGWDDLRRRLLPDRRCFAFFHPQLPSEPLIFVEVALVPDMPQAIAPLIEKAADPVERKRFKVATFYSISNCQPGLRGVSLGNFLIKRVAERLKADFPSIRSFCTLSPIPGLVRWIDASGTEVGNGLGAIVLKRLAGARRNLDLNASTLQQKITAGWRPETASANERAALLELSSIYLRLVSPTADGDAVAKFHLGNGARLQRINWAADLSRNGVRQSCGLMVNYLYDLARVEDNHQRFLDGEVVHARSIARTAR
jgi:malonyl-CoA decarboxylase